MSRHRNSVRASRSSARSRIRGTRKQSMLWPIILLIVIFVVFLFAASLTIRACTRESVKYEEGKASVLKEGASSKRELAGNEESASVERLRREVMPDSIVRICMPAPLDGVPEIILRRKAYVVSYNKDTKNPNWVAWHLTSDHTDGPFRRLGNFHEDEDVPVPRATLYDYRGSGWSRGHMCPAGDNKWDETAMYESFSLTNVCPQNASLNSGLWNSIEIDCRRWASQFGELYVVCGPIYMNTQHETIGNNDVVVPEAFFKVVLCLQGEPKAFGFIVRNTDGTKKRDLYYNTVDQVERITGMDFFPTLPDEIENEVEAKFNPTEWGIR